VLKGLSVVLNICQLLGDVDTTGPSLTNRQLLRER